MPLLSFVLVAEGDRADAEACAAALVGPELTDVEVVTVDAEPGGVGRARDLGLERATGDYVWFLDPAGRPAPGALAGIGEQLRASDPDVLLVDRGAHRRLLARVAEAGVTSLDRRRGLAAAAAQLTDKVFRRSLLAGLDVRFGEGPGGELPVTWAALLAAERVAAIPGARYTGARPDRGAPPDPGALIDAVLAIAARPELPEARRRLVLPALMWHELARLERLPAGERPSYFAGARGRVAPPPQGGREARQRSRREAADPRARPRQLPALPGGPQRAPRSPRRDARPDRGDRARTAQGARAAQAPARAPLPRLPAPARRSRPRRLRRLLVPRLLLQPAGDLREGARARPRHARRLGRQARRRSPTCRPGIDYVVARHAGVLRRRSPGRGSSSTTSTSPTTSSSARARST